VRLDVACAAEGAEYVAHSAAMLHSVLDRHRGDEVHVHFMHGPDIGEELERPVREMVEREGGAISFLRIPDSEIEGLPTKGFTRKATWYRIFLPDLLPDVDRILYLDADLIVVDSLAPLWELDLHGSWVGAVTNVFQDNHLGRPAALGLAGPKVYFNAGVLLMNLAEMRRDARTRALLDYGVRNAERLEWRDQDALNVVLGERRLELDPRWNVMNSFFLFPGNVGWRARRRLRQARRGPAIRHFEGPDVNKPWHYMCPWELKELYDEHRRATPWPSYRPDGRTARNVVRRRLARGRRRVVA
jgi:lipopolysaccharide biosynthesis glycosyltransferase